MMVDLTAASSSTCVVLSSENPTRHRSKVQSSESPQLFANAEPRKCACAAHVRLVRIVLEAVGLQTGSLLLL